MERYVLFGLPRASSSGRNKYGINTKVGEYIVPGAHILSLLQKLSLKTNMSTSSSSSLSSSSHSVNDSSNIMRQRQQQMRHADHLRRLCALSQAALFYLSIEARFLAFRYLPQLRDESYNVVAVSSAPDTFVQAYVRHMNKLFGLIKYYLPVAQIKYVALTVAKPATELVLQELGRLRDKSISRAGLARLKTDLLVMQTTLQLILPLDHDVRQAVSQFFTRPVLFLQYILNTDVVNDLLATGNYKIFNLNEIETLIYLVFRQVTGANNDSAACAQIKLFHEKLKEMHTLHTVTPSSDPLHISDDDVMDCNDDEAEKSEVEGYEGEGEKGFLRNT
uniref:Exocyst complex component Sec8 n=1 Tax=Lygus hesperus TaxID=30085 RepID=A0A0A9WNB7_LYGHE